MRILLLFTLVFFVNICSLFSQNLSLEELINLQSYGKPKIEKFFKDKLWIIDSTNDHKWMYINSVKIDSSEAVFILRDTKCKENIITYMMNDSLNYIKLKSEFSKKNLNNKFKFTYIDVEDYSIKNKNIRFFETHEPDNAKYYAIWIFSDKDILFFGNLNKFCFPDYKKENCYKKNYNTSDTNSSPKIKLPEFPGGEKEIKRFVDMNLEYPQKAMNAGIEGFVKVRYTVEIDGSITNPEIVKSLGGGCDEEVIRLVNLMPRFMPCTINGIPIKSMTNYTVKFSLF